MRREITNRGWAAKAGAGVLLGFILALGVSGLFRLAFGVTDTFFSTKGQFAMWLMSPIWAAIVSLCFLFPSGRAAWGWLGLASGVVWGALALAGALA